MYRGDLTMFSFINSDNHDQWVILAIFFGLFALAGLFNKPRARQYEYYHFLLFGFLIVAANAVLIYFLNKSGATQHSILGMVLLKKMSIESSFMVFGYCLAFRGIGQFIRLQFSPSTYSKRI